MKTLKHDLPKKWCKKGCSSMDWLLNLSYTEIKTEIKNAITYRAKTKPSLQAKRSAALIGLVMSIENTQTRNIILDYVISVINEL